MSKSSDSISLPQARRLAITAQGLGRAGQGRLECRHLKKCLAGLGVLQIDSVNVLVRAHYLPLFSRLGAYAPDDLDRLAWASRPAQRFLFEYWGHEASFMPLELYPLLRWRMERAERGEGIYQGLARFGREEEAFISQVFDAVAEQGPLGAGALNKGGGTGAWWGWSREKTALEWLFAAGRVTVAARRGFERLYDLPERVIPGPILADSPPDEAEAQRRLVMLAARALGVATEKDLRDYYRLTATDGKARVAELVEEGRLKPVRVEGWKQEAYIEPETRFPRRVETGRLISPFDSLIWERSRTERLFDFTYRLEFYTPPEKRVYGYHVLPFLYGDRLVGRIDLKADRAAGCLRALAVHAEGGGLTDEALVALASNLLELAGWLGLSSICVEPEGEPARRLAAEISKL